MNKKIFLSVTLLILFTITGCKKFLIVDPKSTISEKQLFTSEIGFQQALIGAYSQMATRGMYGENLSMGFASVIAQNYNAASQLFPFAQSAALNFTTADGFNYSNAIWNSSYNVIAGLNNILTQIDAQKNIFTLNNYEQIKGEALGLRAYLHFDLLRLYGATYSTGASKKAIPYRIQINSVSQMPATVEEASLQALADLKNAEDLLKTVDPILTGQTNRRFYMNYLAIKALEARIHLFRGDYANAELAALEVVNSNKFTFVTPGQISAAAGNRDRLFSTEQVFSLRVKQIRDWVEISPGYFKTSGPLASDLTRTAANFNTLYETASGGSTDYRYVYLLESDGSVIYPSKFWQTWAGADDQTRLDQTVPLIRLSEMYYILAECASVPTNGLAFLNTIRLNRGLPQISATGLTAQKLTDEITKEYQKEFYAEGQLFYYYKRRAFVRMQFNTRNLTEANYILPVSATELEFNPNY